jgi:hypothetical protein
MTTNTDTWIDLANRENDGLEVTLLWCATTGRAKVAVNDSKRGDAFEFRVAAADALEAFHHPFAYAPASHSRAAETRVHTDLQLQI